MAELGLYLNNGLRQDVAAGRHNFFKILSQTFESQGFKVYLFENTEAERIASVDRDGYSLFHLENPFHDRALDVRLAYMYPFWRIEKAQWREEFRVARAAFDPSKFNDEAALKFWRFWRRKLLPDLPPRNPAIGTVLIALQGRLDELRHGQTMTPIEMIRETLAQDGLRQIVIKLHPKEKYTEAELDFLEEFHDLDRVTFSGDDLPQLLSRADYVVTQNSSVAFKGLLQNVPAILFGAADFHHIFQNVNTEGAARAFRNVTSMKLPAAKYFYWFLQENCINAGRKDAGERILANCRELGWQV